MPLQSKATFLGHAMHPMIVPIPIGALSMVLVFDVLYVVTRTDAWFLAALVANLVGVVGILAAAVPGYVDYAKVVPKTGHVRTTARRHMIVGLTLAALYLVLLAVRWTSLPTPGDTIAWLILAGSVVGAGLLGVQGYLGGSLVEHHHIGTETDAPPNAPAPGGGRE